MERVLQVFFIIWEGLYHMTICKGLKFNKILKEWERETDGSIWEWERKPNLFKELGIAKIWENLTSPYPLSTNSPNSRGHLDLHRSWTDCNALRLLSFNWHLFSVFLYLRIIGDQLSTTNNPILPSIIHLYLFLWHLQATII